jgi:2-keto-3-deoxy-L-rhamnonate aldolase RhmA
VDSIFIGPADLSASMGFLGDMGNQTVQDKLRAGAQACKRLGKPCGIVGANPENVASFLDYGFSWVAVGSDLAMLASRATEYLGAVRSRIGAASKV